MSAPSLMPGSVKTEAVVLRTLRYGEADRILHLYTPQRGRVAAIAKGVRRAKSRFGGRLEPYFRLQMVLYEGRSELLTVTSADTITGHPHLSEHGPALDSAARACDAVARLFETTDPHPGVFALLCNELALLDARPGAGDARQPARVSPQAAARRRPRAAARRLRRVRRGRPPVGVLGRRRRRRLQRLRGDRLRARRGGAHVHDRRAGLSAGRCAGGRRARAAPGGAGDRRDRRAPRARPLARGAPRGPPTAIGSRAMGVAPAGTKWVYDFAEGSKEMRNLLGGKGANVAEMTRILGADRVPAGFTITTEACVSYMEHGQSVPDGMDGRSTRRSPGWRTTAGKTLGDPEDPLLVSVRSGARESMPGMLDTVLNLGLNDRSVAGPRREDRQRALRLGLLPALRADVRQRRARHPRRALRAGDQGGQAGARRHARHRARRRGAAGAHGTLSRDLPGGDGGGVPAGAARPARAGDPRGVRLLDRRPRRHLPAHEPHPRRLGHRGQRPADGVRQQGRHLGLRRRVQPRRGDR